MSASATGPVKAENIEENTLACTALVGKKSTPAKREKAKIDLKVFSLGFINQTKCRESSFSDPNYIVK